MTSGSLLFMLLSWAFVLGLLFWSYSKIFAAQARRTDVPPADPRVPPVV